MSAVSADARFHRLMVAALGDPGDEGLLRYAAAVARIGAVGEVGLAHVLPADPAPDARARALDGLRAAGGRAFAAGDAVKLSHHVLHGPLLDRLLEHAVEWGADLALVGDGRDRRRALARRMAMKAPCSVWVVPDSPPAAVERVLVPVDLSDRSADALRVATALAAAAGLREVTALHVYFNEARVTFEEYGQILRGQEREEFARFVAPLDTHGVTVTPVFEEGAVPAHVILRTAAARRSDLIVLASRGRSRSAAILLGSVAEDTVLESEVPVLVVKHFGARLGVLQALLDRAVHPKRGLQFD